MVRPLGIIPTPKLIVKHSPLISLVGNNIFIHEAQFFLSPQGVLRIQKILRHVIIPVKGLCKKNYISEMLVHKVEPQTFKSLNFKTPPFWLE